MQLTNQQIKDVTQTMTDFSNELFEKIDIDINNPKSIEDVMRQSDWIEMLDKTKLSFETLIQYVGKGAAILFVNKKLLSVKWYNLFGLIKLISVGKLFYDLIIEVYKIWSK